MSSSDFMIHIKLTETIQDVIKIHVVFNTKIVSEYDQEIPQSQTVHNPVAPRGGAVQPS